MRRGPPCVLHASRLKGLRKPERATIHPLSLIITGDRLGNQILLVGRSKRDNLPSLRWEVVWRAASVRRPYRGLQRAGAGGRLIRPRAAERGVTKGHCSQRMAAAAVHFIALNCSFLLRSPRLSGGWRSFVIGGGERCKNRPVSWFPGQRVRKRQDHNRSSQPPSHQRLQHQLPPLLSAFHPSLTAIRHCAH
jgi:hypothetical protein